MKHLLLTTIAAVNDVVAISALVCGVLLLVLALVLREQLKKVHIKTIKDSGVLAGLAINPSTGIAEISDYLDLIDYVLVMSVNPGFGGQGFIDSTLDKMKALSKLSEKHNFVVGVDGGVNLETIDRVYETGVDVTIVGSGLYKAEDVPSRFNELMKQN
mgnify:CR=1 FL=1